MIAIATLVGASALSLNAQTGSQQPPQQPTQQQQRPAEPRSGDATQRAGQNAQNITVTGCLKAEKDVAGQRPSVAEQAGMGNDFVLTNVKMSQTSTTSGIGLASMYEIEGMSESELQKHVNHQVEIVGRLETTGSTGSTRSGAAGTTGAATGTTGTGATGATGTTGTGATGTTGTTGTASRGTAGQSNANADLPKLEATSLKMVAATCPAQ